MTKAALVSLGSATAVVAIAVSVSFASHQNVSAVKPAGADPSASASTVLAPASVVTDLVVGQTISIQPGTGLTFVPADPPDPEAGYMSAAEAWATWEDGAALESDMDPQFGAVTQLTAPAGTPGVEMTYSNDAVWAFRQAGCLDPMGGTVRPSHRQSMLPGQGSSGDADASPSEPTDVPSTNQFGPCILWTFLDASTGQGVLITQQTVSAPETPN